MPLETLSKVYSNSAESQPPESEPVKLLCLGMCRTGTSSLLQVLTALGYTPMHMTRILDDPRQKRLWIEAIERTFLNADPKTYCGRAEFDILFRGYDVALDVPCAIFGEQLIEAYPDAKIILTTRSPESWVRSMQSTIWRFMTLPSYRLLRLIEPEFVGSFMRLVELIFRVHNNNTYGGKAAARAYAAHNDRIKAAAPGDRFLELSPPFDLERLCKFLGKPLPPGGYPHINSTEDYMPKICKRRNQSIGRVLKRSSGLLLLVFPLVMLMCYYAL